MQAISWSNFRDYIDRGHATVCPVDGAKGLSLFVAPSGTSIGLRIPIDKEVEIHSGLRKLISGQIAMVLGKRVIELSTDRAELFHSFYLLAYAIAELVETHNLDPIAAIDEAFECLGLLLVERSLLSEQVRIGLFGELCFLSALLTAQGISGFAAWLGPRNERHDFRFGENEFEVKTTIGNRRRHIIHGLAQLEPSPGKKLFIVSLHLERAGPGAGQSLPEKISAVRQQASAQGKVLDGYVEGLGSRLADAVFYVERYQFRAAAVLIPVVADCPRITSEIVSQTLDPKVTARLHAVSYEIDVEGIGHDDDTAAFKACLPTLSLKGQP